jgi:hypothetical protein
VNWTDLGVCRRLALVIQALRSASTRCGGALTRATLPSQPCGATSSSSTAPSHLLNLHAHCHRLTISPHCNPLLNTVPASRYPHTKDTPAEHKEHRHNVVCRGVHRAQGGSVKVSLIATGTSMKTQLLTEVTETRPALKSKT